jgi:hypothetical protein
MKEWAYVVSFFVIRHRVRVGPTASRNRNWITVLWLGSHGHVMFYICAKSVDRRETMLHVGIFCDASHGISDVRMMKFRLVNYLTDIWVEMEVFTFGYNTPS